MITIIIISISLTFKPSASGQRAEMFLGEVDPCSKGSDDRPTALPDLTSF